MTNKDEKRVNKKPEPFKPAPYQRFDPTANFTMPISALAAMVNAVPDNFLRDVVRDNRAPMTPATIPASSQQVSSNVRTGGTGWSASIPLSPPPGVAQADRLMNAQDQRDRAELIEREARFRAMQEMAEQTEAMRKRAETLAKLAEQMK